MRISHKKPTKKNVSSSCDYNVFMFCFLGFDRNLVELFLGGSYEY